MKLLSWLQILELVVWTSGQHHRGMFLIDVQNILLGKILTYCIHLSCRRVKKYLDRGYDMFKLTGYPFELKKHTFADGAMDPGSDSMRNFSDNPVLHRYHARLSHLTGHWSIDFSQDFLVILQIILALFVSKNHVQGTLPHWDRSWQEFRELEVIFFIIDLTNWAYLWYVTLYFNKAFGEGWKTHRGPWGTKACRHQGL